MARRRTGRIYDTVYGYIELEPDEFDLVNSPVFQRLQRIKQTGPLHILFPGAVHTRYSHSLGVFHIVKKMISHLKRAEGESGTNFFGGKKQEKELLFAALLHDIGHVPLSHVGENVLIGEFEAQTGRKYKTPKDKKKVSAGDASWRTLFDDAYLGSSTKLHECLSAEIVLHDKEIQQLLNSNELPIGRENIAKIIAGTHKEQKFNSLLHSELDADRLDYLLRDSYYTGVGYGHIDLDYIISRLIMPPDHDVEDNSVLCVEQKGLHTIEHYILSRFFLRTQVLHNRKARFLDLLFSDVMEYMLSAQRAGHKILCLKKLLACIRSEKSDDRHRVYAYTDDLVFMKMRKIHEDLDKSIKENRLRSRKDDLAYINDCVKMIMDGQIPEPIESAQLLVPVERNEKVSQRKRYQSRRRAISQKAEAIAAKAAEELKIPKCRIKVDVKAVGVMKYSDVKDTEGKSELEPNMEAVRIYNENAKNSKDQVKFAAKSNASILKTLVDKELLLFNVFYVKSSKEQESKVRDKIKEYFKGFVAKEFQNAKLAV